MDGCIIDWRCVCGFCVMNRAIGEMVNGLDFGQDKAKGCWGRI